MTVAQISLEKSLAKGSIAGTAKDFSSMSDEIFRAPSPAMADEHPDSQSVKDRLKALGWTQQRFSQYLELHKTTMTKWWLAGLPTYAMRLIELMERHHVSPSWKGGRNTAAPTDEDAAKAMSSAMNALVDDALLAGWSRPLIASVLRSVADKVEKPQF